jgi:hypothetical protein
VVCVRSYSTLSVDCFHCANKNTNKKKKKDGAWDVLFKKTNFLKVALDQSISARQIFSFEFRAISHRCNIKSSFEYSICQSQH